MLGNSLVVSRKTIESNYSRDDLDSIFGNLWKAHEDKPLIGRDHILASICPQVCKSISMIAKNIAFNSFIINLFTHIRSMECTISN